MLAERDLLAAARPARATEEELQLLEAARQGDSRAFEQLVSPHLNWIYSLALRLMTREQDAQEICQEVLIRAWQRLSDFRGHSRFTTWLYRIAVNACLDELRKRRRREANVISLDAEVPTEEESLPRQMPDRLAISPEQTASRAELLKHVEAALARLPTPYRIVIVLIDLEGRNYQEAADILRLPLGTVKSRLNRARQLLRRALAPYLSEVET